VQRTTITTLSHSTTLKRWQRLRRRRLLHSRRTEAEAGFSKREMEAEAEDCADVHKYVWLLPIGRALLLYTLPYRYIMSACCDDVENP
jgi:hypothetical protein